MTGGKSSARVPAIGGASTRTIIVPSGRTSTVAAPAYFAARMALATSACVMMAARRDMDIPLSERERPKPPPSGF